MDSFLFITNCLYMILFSKLLGKIIDTIKADLSMLHFVETADRDLVVSATSFKSDAVVIEIDAHLRISEALKEGELKTAVISSIAKCIQSSYIKAL